MLKIITNNWQIKLLSLIVGIGFWTYVSSNSIKVADVPGGIPVEMRNVQDGTVAISAVDKIDLKLTAEKQIWSKISADSIKAYVNLSGLSSGTHELPIQVEIDIAGVQISDYTPHKALVRIEPKVSKSVPVNVKIEGSAGDGLVASIPVVDPENVEIFGAKSIVDKILEATAVIRLDGDTNDVNKKVKLVALNADNEKILNINFNPEEVNVEVPIVKAESTKTVGIKVQTTGQIAQGYWISNISTNPSEVTITGKSTVLKTINYISTKQINIDNLDKNTTKNIELDVPAGITIVDQVNSVNVTLQINQTSTTKQIPAKINTQNLASNLKIDNIDAEKILVNIAGDNKILENVASDAVKINLDLAKYTTEGIYYLDVTNSMIELPANTTIVNFFPSSVKITLSKK